MPSTVPSHRERAVLVLLALLLALTLPVFGCRKQEPVDVAELFTTRATAMNFLQRGQLPEAEEQFKKLIRLAPDDPLGYANLGLTYLRGGRYREAEAPLRRAQRLDPDNPEVGLIVARLYSLTGQWDRARETLEALRTKNPRNAKVLYALAEVAARDSSEASNAAYEARLRDVLAAAPANQAVRLRLADVLLRRGATDSVVRILEEAQQVRPALPRQAEALLDSCVALLHRGQLAAARGPFDRFLRLMETTQPYQAALAEVNWLEGPIVGRPVLTFKPQSLIQMLGVTGRTADRMRFSDITVDAGFDEPRDPRELLTSDSAAPPAGVFSVLATGDLSGDGTEDLFVNGWSRRDRAMVSRLYALRAGEALDVSAQWSVALSGSMADVAIADYDNDGWLDVFAVGSDGAPHLMRNTGTRKLEDVTARSAIGRMPGARKLLFADLDHDGDLDVFVGGDPNRVYRNNADGTFTEVAAAMGLAGGGGRDAAFADFDGDGRVDVLVASSQGVSLYRNTGLRRFDDVTAASGLVERGGATAVAIADYDNDGRFDVLVVAPSAAPALWLGKGDGTFTRDTRSDATFQRSATLGDVAVRFADVDNDGWLDLFIVGTRRDRSGKGGVLLRNDRTGRFQDRPGVVPASVHGGRTIQPSDIDDDGDVDFIIGDASGVRVLRNEEGNANLSVQVALFGLRTGSGKNNDFGVGARLELRAGEIYQTRVVTEPVTHFGLGSHLKADVLRIEWPNGVPQTVYFPGTDQDVLELQQLKGSCAFAYTWDGKGFRFVTDVMWRSALGMPLGLMGSTSAFAPAGASQEYLRIPGEALQPRDGRYVMQLTEELWETAYADQVNLLAVDHPDSVDVFVDERFVPPGPLELRLYHVGQRWAPRSAIDDRGADVLPQLREHDDIYVSNLVPARYQGVVEPHAIVLDLGEEAGRPGTSLFLRGWIYPTDASINVALSQQSEIAPFPPSLEVRDAAGRWTRVSDIGFPSGKDKTIAIDLAGKFPTADHRVRIRTNMQIYWDEAFVGVDRSNSPVKITTLQPMSADLHYRGFSRMYRKGGRYGPFWFAYDDVSKDSPWRPIAGSFTRFGDVRTLLEHPDDMYVIMGPGDEATIEFDASSARTLPPGWKRDFLLYTDGWIKDSDLNTAFGTTVEPLPFHAIKSYPYAPGDSYPADLAHRRYLRDDNQRHVGRHLSPP